MILKRKRWIVATDVIDMVEKIKKGLSEREVAFWMNRKCGVKDCWNITCGGYIYCVHHLYGFPEKIPDTIRQELEKIKAE